MVSAVRNGLVGRSRLKQSQVRPRALQLGQRVLDPLDVGRRVAGERGRPQERHLGAVVPRDRRDLLRVGRDDDASNTPLSSAGAIV